MGKRHNQHVHKPVPQPSSATSGGYGKGYVQSSYTSGGQCHHTHPPYNVSDEIVIYGGSGLRPFVKDCEIYVALDDGARPGPRSWPWIKGQEFVFPITNFKAPSDPEQFKHLINWLEDKLRAGKKVHVGCMAGHGRTGIVLAALRAQMAKDPKAIEHVRANYCKKAVETDAQVRFLVEHYACDDITSRYGGTGQGWAGTLGSTYGNKYSGANAGVRHAPGNPHSLFDDPTFENMTGVPVSGEPLPERSDAQNSYTIPGAWHVDKDVQ